VASQKAKNALSSMWNSTYENETLYQILDTARSRLNEEGTCLQCCHFLTLLDLTPQQQRLVKKTMDLFAKNGMGLDPEKKQRLAELKSELFKLADQFCTNINEDNTTMEVACPSLLLFPFSIVLPIQFR
jgi:Zn-dependent oligopeptidase